MSDKGVCRTAPASPGLLNISVKRGLRAIYMLRSQIMTPNFSKNFKKINSCLVIHFNDFFVCSIKCGEYKIFDYTFIMNTQVDIENNLLRYLSQKCSQCFDMLKREIF